MSCPSCSAWAEINLGRLAENLAAVWQGRARRNLIAVVKADAYGHGAVEVSRRLVAEGVTMLAVATVSEAAALRAAGIKAPLLLLGAYLARECEDILDLDLAVSVSSAQFAADLDRAAGERGAKPSIHVKVDTGMGRLGIPASKAVPVIEQISMLPNLNLEGIFTHFASADEEDKEFTLRQISEFSRVVNALEGMGVRFKYHHTAASAACLEVPESHFDTLRPGISLYGLHPAPRCEGAAELKPIMEFCSRLVHVDTRQAGSTIGYGRTHRLAKETHVGVVSVGYADGYDRRFSGKAVVTVNGVSVPVLGRVSMDLISVDLSAVRTSKPGEKVVLFSSDPSAPNSVENLAQLIDTIPYTLTCGVSKRVERVYRN